MAKKSSSKVAIAPVVEKSGEKGKREAEVPLEKKSNSKKTKKDGTVQQAIEKKKSELKIQKKVDSSTSSDESSQDEPIAAPTKKVPASAAKNGSVPAKKSKDDSDSESEISDSDSEEPKVANLATKNGSIASVKESGGSSEEEVTQESDGSSSDEKDDGSDDSDDEGVDEPAKTPKKANTDVKMADAVSDKKAPKTPSTPQAAGSKTLFTGNLSFQIEEANLREFFESAGEVVSVRFANDKDGRFRGFGHVEFATEAAAQKALELNQKELLGRPIKLDLALERGAITPANGKDSSSQKGQTVFVKGLDTSLGEDGLRGVLEEHFGKCGEITRISIPKDIETGGPKGFAYIDFKDNEAFQKALELDQSEVGGFSLTVDEAKPRVDGAGSGRGRGGRFGSGRGGRFGSGGRGRRGGGRGGRDNGGRSGGRGGRGRGNFGGKKTKFDD